MQLYYNLVLVPTNSNGNCETSYIDVCSRKSLKAIESAMTKAIKDLKSGKFDNRLTDCDKQVKFVTDVFEFENGEIGDLLNGIEYAPESETYVKRNNNWVIF